MPIFFIYSMTANARSDFTVSGSLTIDSHVCGTTRQEIPNLSFSHPHGYSDGSRASESLPQ